MCTETLISNYLAMKTVIFQKQDLARIIDFGFVLDIIALNENWFR